MLTVRLRRGGAETVVAQTPLPGGDAGTVDLRLKVDASPRSPYNGDPTASVSYALDGASTFTAVTAAPVTIPTGWVTASTPAGILTSQPSGDSPFTASFASFSVARGS